MTHATDFVIPVPSSPAWHDQLRGRPREEVAEFMLKHMQADPVLSSRIREGMARIGHSTPPAPGIHNSGRDHAPVTSVENARRGGTDDAPSTDDALAKAGATVRDSGIIAESLQMHEVSKIIRRFAATDAPVLITGESGTGKEVAARAIHAGSKRNRGPFVAVNCAALPAELIASELFGYEKGAFTGAVARKIGQIEHANGGTLFLDEIGDMPTDLQSHLLRFLQEGKIVRLGGRGDVVDVDVRIISATNVRLQAAMASGRFREDLFFRLNVLSLHIPPLREREGDLEVLAHYFLADSARQVGRPVAGFSPEAMEALRRHDWPGNVRELKSTVFRAVVMTNSATIQPEDLALDQSVRRSVVEAPPPARAKQPRRAGRADVVQALERNAWNVTVTSRELGISRVTLYRMLKRFNIDLDRSGSHESPVDAA